MKHVVQVRMVGCLKYTLNRWIVATFGIGINKQQTLEYSFTAYLFHFKVSKSCF